MRSIKILLLFLFIGTFSLTGQAQTQQEAMQGEIKLFAGNFAPKGWALCEGQILAISSYQSLFAVLGTSFGGDGRTTFALPDLRGRTPIGPGAGPGLTPKSLGQRTGTETHTLTIAQMPSHIHGNAQVYIPAVPLQADGSEVQYTEGTTSFISVGNEGNDVLQVGANALEGRDQAFSIMQPSLGVHYIICIEGGLYPSRN